MVVTNSGYGYQPTSVSVCLVTPYDKTNLTFIPVKVDLLVEHRSLYATYGKVHGRFLDGQADK